MAVNLSPSFSFKSFSDFQSESPHLNTDVLLRQGHMTVGGNRYKISLSANDKILVSREHTPTKVGRFFNGMSDLFMHRVADDATSSRSHRMGEALNYRRSVEAKASSWHSGLRPSTSEPHRHPSPSAALEKKLTLDDFRDQEKKRADYFGESPSEQLAQKAYARYSQDKQHAAPIRRTKSDPLPRQEKPEKLDHRTFDYFMQQENKRANYHSESPSKANAEEAFANHIMSQKRPSRERNDTYFNRMQAPNHASEAKTSAPYDHNSEMNRVKNELDSADYYGTSPNVSHWERQMYEASQRPMKTETAGLRRHQSAPSVLQSVPSHKTSRTGNVIQSPKIGIGMMTSQLQLKRGINIGISKLPLQEQVMPTRAMALFNRAAPRMEDNSKLEVLNHINELMAKPTTQRNKGMGELQDLLRDIIKGKAL